MNNKESVGDIEHKPTVSGVGFMGVGKYGSRLNGKMTKQYLTWKSMLARCYSKRGLELRPTYVNCTVCKEWHNFQNFAEWFDENYIEGFHLDKDIKFDGNKIYSPATCSFVSPSENTVKASAKRYIVTSPIGVEREIYNMNKFCRANGLNQGHMIAVAKGKELNHKGWTAKINQ